MQKKKWNDKEGSPKMRLLENEDTKALLKKGFAFRVRFRFKIRVGAWRIGNAFTKLQLYYDVANNRFRFLG